MERTLIDVLLFAMEGKDPSKAIELQEKREQQNVVRYQRLPKRTNSGIPNEEKYKGILGSMEYEEREAIMDSNIFEFTKRQYEQMGIKVIKEYDDLFYSVELPEGWEIKATGHSMWNNVLDEKGRKRISFFYKGAFYDRDAFSNFEIRYFYKSLPFDEYKDENVTFEDRMFKPWKLFITDCGDKLVELAEITPTTQEEYFGFDKKFNKIATDYLDKNYPDWKNIHSYWD